MSSHTAALPVRADDYQLILAEHELHLTVADRCYRVRGLDKNTTHGQLKVNLLASRRELVYTDTLDLCLARLRRSFVQAAAQELYCEEEILKRDLGRLLLELARDFGRYLIM